MPTALQKLNKLINKKDPYEGMSEGERKLTKLSKMIDNMDWVRKEDFLEAFTVVVKSTKDTREKLLADMSAFASIVKEIEKKLTNVANGEVESFKADVKKVFAKMEREQSENLNFIRDKVRSVTYELESRSPDGDLLKKMEALIPEPEKPFELIDAIEVLKKEVERLKKELSKTTDKKMLGGGVTDNGVKFALGRLVKTETPVGDIDGANKEYRTVAKITSIIHFAINGQVIHPSEYSISGSLITFTTALDDSLSGTSFTITYL